jgi:hypothetical protein
VLGGCGSGCLWGHKQRRTQTTATQTTATQTTATRTTAGSRPRRGGPCARPGGQRTPGPNRCRGREPTAGAKDTPLAPLKRGTARSPATLWAGEAPTSGGIRWPMNAPAGVSETAHRGWRPLVGFRHQPPCERAKPLPAVASGGQRTPGPNRCRGREPTAAAKDTPLAPLKRGTARSPATLWAGEAPNSGGIRWPMNAPAGVSETAHRGWRPLVGFRHQPPCERAKPLPAVASGGQ